MQSSTMSPVAWAKLYPPVLLTGTQTLNGIKTFSSFPISPSSAPTLNYQFANKKFVDDTASTLQTNIDTVETDLTTLINAVPTGLLSSNEVMELEYTQLSGTSGGASAAGSIKSIKFNSVLRNTIAGAANDSATGDITLPAGLYYFEGEGIGYSTGETMALIYRGGYKIYGTAQRINSGYQQPCSVKGFYTHTTGDFRFMIYSQLANVDGLGRAGMWTTTRFAKLMIWKMS